MDKSNAAQFLPLVQAVADGKTIQLLKATFGGKREWIDLSPENITFGFFDPAFYRIKPEPRTYYLIQFDGVPYTNPYAYTCRAVAEREMDRMQMRTGNPRSRYSLLVLKEVTEAPL